MACCHDHGNRSPSRISWSSWARRGPTQSVTRSPPRSVTRRSKSATGPPRSRGLSTPPAGNSCCRGPARNGSRPSSKEPVSRSPCSSTIHRCSTTLRCWNRSAPRRGWRRSTLVCRPRCKPRSPSSKSHGAGSSRPATRSIDGWRRGCAPVPNNVSSASHHGCARCQRRAGTGPTEEALGTIDAQLVATLDELRTLAAGLHPRLLTEAGLAGALEALQGPLPDTRAAGHE